GRYRRREQACIQRKQPVAVREMGVLGKGRIKYRRDALVELDGKFDVLIGSEIDAGHVSRYLCHVRNELQYSVQRDRDRSPNRSDLIGSGQNSLIDDIVCRGMTVYLGAGEIWTTLQLG